MEQKNPWGLAAKNSFIIAIFATIGSVILGTVAALGLSSRHMPYKGLIMAVLISPMIVPLIISGVAIFFLYGKSWFSSNSYRDCTCTHDFRNTICCNHSYCNIIWI
jgi:ABC-type spermidine/putrescine transport system permease subunit II